MGIEDGGGGMRASGSNMTVRRAPGTAHTTKTTTASLSHFTTLKSTAPPSSDPFPVVTYRHLLSAGSLTPANPLRVIAHCDVDAAYAQFEALRLGIDSFAVPLAVQQWQGLIAIGYKAREFGINRHCDMQKAKELCPELHCVHVQTIAPGDAEPAYHANPRPETHKVSLDPYRRESRKILASFKSTCPLGQVEKASIDESYFDLTVEVRKMILMRYPHLKQVPQTGRGMDEPLPAPPLIEWDGCGELMPIKRLDSEGNHVDADGDEGFVPSQEHQLLKPTWTDVALAHGALLMTTVRQNVIKDVGYTTSAGIASNKTLAKLCSGFRKPNNQTTLLPRAVPAFLRDLPVSKIRFLGGRLGREMGDMWDAKTVGDLWSVPLEQMQAHFGPEAAWVHAVLRGVDHSPVSARIANKTMLASKNLRPFIRKRDEALGWLDTLATELVARLKEVWEDEHSATLEDKTSIAQIGEASKTSPLIPTLWPKFLVLRFIRARGEGPRSRQAAFPYVSTLTANDVYKVAVRLWNEACDEIRLGSANIPRSGSGAGSASVHDTLPVEVVTIALGFSGLERAETGQKTIEGFFGGNGNGKRKRVEGSERAEKKEDEEEKVLEDEERTMKWKCDECAQTFSVKIDVHRVRQETNGIEEEFFDSEDPFTLSTETEPPLIASNEEARSSAQQKLDVQIQDHKDWHFAVKLSASQDWPGDSAQFPTSHTSSAPSATLSSKPAPAKKPKKGSLQAFFAKQK